MSPELAALLERNRRDERLQNASVYDYDEAIAAMLDGHRMAYRTRRSAMLATSNLTRARQL